MDKLLEENSKLLEKYSELNKCIELSRREGWTIMPNKVDKVFFFVQLFLFKFGPQTGNLHAF